MRGTIDIDVQIDAECADPKVVIRTRRRTQDVENIVCAIENCMADSYPMLTVREGSKLEMLSQREIVRAFREGRKLVVQTERGSFVMRKTLAELEQVLNRSRFLRISRSEIINLYKVASFDFNLSGTIRVHFDDGGTTWVSRRYVRSIQQVLDEM